MPVTVRNGALALVTSAQGGQISMNRFIVGIMAALITVGSGLASTIPATAASSPKASYIVVLKAGSSASADAASAHARYGVAVKHTYTHIFSGYAATMTASDAKALRAEPSVSAVVPDGKVHAAGCTGPVCAITPQVTTRAVRRIGGEQSSAKSGNGKGTIPVNVAVLDSGIQLDHPELTVKGGVNCAGDGNPTFGDVQGHGTIVGGLIGAQDNSFGIVGIVPGAHLWSVRVLDANLDGSDSAILCGLDWVAGTQTDNNQHNDIAVANMSLEGPLEAPLDGHCGNVVIDPIHQAICKVTNAGVSIVVAAGNDSVDLGTIEPAAYPEVLTMAGMTDTDGLPGGTGPPDPCHTQPVQTDDTPATFSNFATSQADMAHTLAAPAVCDSSDYLGSNVATDSGTSFASPLGTGVVALCIADGPCGGLSAKATIRKVINDTTRYNTKNPTWGFSGDPLRPVTGKYYGWLLQAGLY